MQALQPSVLRQPADRVSAHYPASSTTRKLPTMIVVYSSRSMKRILPRLLVQEPLGVVQSPYYPLAVQSRQRDIPAECEWTSNSSSPGSVSSNSPHYLRICPFPLPIPSASSRCSGPASLRPLSFRVAPPLHLLSVGPTSASTRSSTSSSWSTESELASTVKGERVLLNIAYN